MERCRLGGDRHQSGKAHHVASLILLTLLAVVPQSSCLQTDSHFDVNPDSLLGDEVALRDMFVSLKGETWPEAFRQHWSDRPLSASSTPSCCNVNQEWVGAACQHAFKRIVHLYHRSGFASGELPPSVATMSKLDTIDFSENKLTGGLPPFGSKAALLQSIALAGNSISGMLPETIGQMPQLRFLALSRNKLTGQIPASIGDASRLEALLLDGNEFYGEVPWSALLRLHQLRHLRLDGNVQLKGTVRASEIVNALPNLIALELAGCPKLKLVWDDDRLSDLHLLTLPTESYAGRDDAGGRRQPRGSLSTAVFLNSNQRAPVHVPRGDVDAPHRFMAMGDFGTGASMTGSGRELASAYHFKTFAQWVDAEFTITVGDNMYCPPWIPLEVFFQESFEVPYSTRELNRPWYAGMGNHDSYTETEFAKRVPKWKMSSTEYAVKSNEIFSGSDGGDRSLLDLFVHDSYSKLGRFGRDFWRQLDSSLNASVRSPTPPRFTVSTAHFPPISSGCHKVEKGALAWWHLLQTYNVSAAFAGHDHHSEALIDERTGIFVLLVGGYARGPCTPNRHAASLFREELLGGFTYVTLDSNLMNVTFVSEVGHFQYKVSVPHDWASRGMRRRPTSAEIRQYAAGLLTTTTAAPVDESQTTVPPTTRGEAEDSTALPPATPATETQATTSPIESELPSGQQNPSQVQPVAPPSSRPITQRGWSLGWATTASVCGAVPVLLLAALAVDGWRLA